MPKASADFTSGIYRVIIKIYFNLNKIKRILQALGSAQQLYIFKRKKKNAANPIIVIETEKSMHYRMMFQ